MPVTAKLSRAFYEKLGDEVANELVEWLNQVDLAYRADLRELNDLNFARFDAKMGERLAELRAELDARFARVDVVLAERLGELRAELDARFARVDVVLAEQVGQVRKEIRDTKLSMIRWMFAFWVGTGAMVVGWLVVRGLLG